MLVAGCSDPLLPAEDVSTASTPPRAALAVCTAGSSFAQFRANFECGTQINLLADNALIEAVSNAANQWNNTIAASGVAGLPTFMAIQSETAATGPIVEVVGVATATVYCDQTSATVLTLITGSGCSGFTHTGTLDQVLNHALAHVYGWPGTAHQAAVEGVSDHCAIHLRPDGQINDGVCAHEIEGAGAAYGLRSLDPETFWGSPFAVGISGVFDNRTITVGETTQYNLSWRLDRGGVIAGSFQWHSSNPMAATVGISNGTVEGKVAGSATITATPQSLSGVLMTTSFSNGTTAQVTVTAAPLAPLAVQDIIVNAPVPILVSDSLTFTAMAGSGDASGISYRWVITYSNGIPADSIFFPEREPTETSPPWGTPPFAGNSWKGFAPEGSYNIRIKIWPARDGVVGSPTVRDFPVCTQTSTFLRAPDDEETDAKAGCV